MSLLGIRPDSRGDRGAFNRRHWRRAGLRNLQLKNDYRHERCGCHPARRNVPGWYPPDAGLYLEYSIKGSHNQQWADELYIERPYSVKDGTVEVSDTPGWGIEIKPEFLENAEYRVTTA